jgi:NADH:ubiquinone oxidoreductase subunit 5 (subunit L)/multisubunit Na+/H+ antiporter MnhA subunit
MGFVFIISSLVILYSDGYMFGDLNIFRFISLVLMFVVSMFLIVSPNVISILLGWDGLCLVSYLLVIYYQNMKSLPTADLNSTKWNLKFQFQPHRKPRVSIVRPSRLTMVRFF